MHKSKSVTAALNRTREMLSGAKGASTSRGVDRYVRVCARVCVRHAA